MPEVAVQPIVEDEREEEQETCGHNDRRIPLNPRCPKCAALLAPVDWAFIDKMENGGGLAAQLFPERLPGDHSQRAFAEEFPVAESGFLASPVRRAFTIAPVPDAQLGDEEMTILHGDAWLVPDWKRKLVRESTARRLGEGLTLTEKSESYSGLMQKLLSLFTLAITFISGLKSRVDEVTKALADRDTLIADLKGQLDTSNADHAALLERAEKAEAHSAEIDSTAPELDQKADELAQAINDHPATPTVDPATFEVTAPAAQPEGGAAQ